MTSFADVAVGTEVAHSGNFFGVSVTSVQRTITLSGFNVVSQGSWNSGFSASVKHEDLWKQVGNSKIVHEGTWKDTAPTIQRTVSKKRVRLFGSFGANPNQEPSVGVFQIPNDWYIPSGWKIVRSYISGIYDDLLDGIFVYKAGVQEAFILARRNNPNWVGRTRNGWNFTDFTWQEIQNFTITSGLLNGCGADWYCPYIMTPGEIGGGCGSDGCIAHTFFGSAHQTTGVPVDINRVVSVKTGLSCGTCNHGFYVTNLTFEEP
jgi:hypothetical protein